MVITDNRVLAGNHGFTGFEVTVLVRQSQSQFDRKSQFDRHSRFDRHSVFDRQSWFDRNNR